MHFCSFQTHHVYFFLIQTIAFKLFFKPPKTLFKKEQSVFFYLDTL